MRKPSATLRPNRCRDISKFPEIQDILNCINEEGADAGRLLDYLEQAPVTWETDPAQQDGCYGQGSGEMDKPFPDGPKTHGDAPEGTAGVLSHLSLVNSRGTPMG